MPKALGAFSVRANPVPVNASPTAPAANTSSPTEVLAVIFGALVPVKFAVPIVEGTPFDQFPAELHVPAFAPVQVLCANAPEPPDASAAARRIRRKAANLECIKRWARLRIWRMIGKVLDRVFLV